jgi:nitrate reductase NapAB chaperone NapD
MDPPNAIQQVDLTTISPLTEVIIRGGNLSQSNAAQILMSGYTQYRNVPGVYGLSVVFHQGYTLDQLVKAASFPNGSISYSMIARIRAELAALGMGYDMVLWKTHSNTYVDHHTLGITRNGLMETQLEYIVANALIKAFIVGPNPYKRP